MSGFVIALAGAAQLVTARLLPRVIGRVSERMMLGAGASVMGAAYLLCAFASAVWMVAVACWFAGVGWIFCHTTLQTRATEVFPAARGTAIAFFAFSLFLGSGVGALAYGALLESIGFTSSFALTGACLFMFAVIVVRVLTSKRAAAA